MFVVSPGQITSQANASIVSKGKFKFETEGTIVHIIKCEQINRKNNTDIFFLAIIPRNYYNL